MKLTAHLILLGSLAFAQAPAARPQYGSPEVSHDGVIRPLAVM